MTSRLEHAEEKVSNYRLEEQIGFLLRRAHQRHTSLFSNEMDGGLTPTQFAALARLLEMGECTQNRLGRLIAVDAATIKGVVERLQARDWIETSPDPADRRRVIVTLTPSGQAATIQYVLRAIRITERTLQPLAPTDRRLLVSLLKRIA